MNTPLTATQVEQLKREHAEMLAALERTAEYFERHAAEVNIERDGETIMAVADAILHAKGAQ